MVRVGPALVQRLMFTLSNMRQELGQFDQAQAVSENFSLKFCFSHVGARLLGGGGGGGRHRAMNRGWLHVESGINPYSAEIFFLYIMETKVFFSF